MLTSQEIVPSQRGTPGLSGSKDQQNKTDKFLSVYEVMHVIVTSQKDKGEALKEHILKDFVPRGFDARIEKIQGEYNQQARQLQQTNQE